TIMAAGFNGEKTVTNLLIHIDAQDHTVMIRAADIAKVPIDRKYDVLVVLNQLNEKYRWSRFYVDGNETINVQTDQILAGESSGAIVMELILRINSIVNDAFPEIMKAIWG
nr:YbjN domain-containing protein [Clostridiales bacterium]